MRLDDIIRMKVLARCPRYKPSGSMRWVCKREIDHAGPCALEILTIKVTITF